MRCINRQYKYFHLIEYLKLEADINRNTTISYQSDITFIHAKYGYFEVKCIPNVIKRHQRVFVNINSWNREYFLYFSYKYMVLRRLTWHIMLNINKRSAPEEIYAFPFRRNAMIQTMGQS